MVPRSAVVPVAILVAAALALGIHSDIGQGHPGVVATTASTPAATMVPATMPAPPTTAATPAALTPAATIAAPATIPSPAPAGPVPPAAAAPVTGASRAPAAPVAPAVSPGVIGAQALARISYPWARLGYQLAFHGPKDGFLGLTNCSTHHIDIYVTPDQTVAQVTFVTSFEIAHAVDCTYTSPAREAEWPVLRGFRLRGAWFPSCSCSEDAFPSGDFAEVFARWQAGAAYPWRSTLAPAPSAAQLAALVPFLEG